MLFCCILLLCPALDANAQESDANAQVENLRLPATEAADASEEAVSLPDGLRGQWNFVVFSHERKHGKIAEKWSEYLEQQIGEGTEFASVPSYAMVVVDDVPKWIRRLISGGLRSAISEEDYWKFLIVFQDRKPIVDAFNLTERKEVLILLIARDGTTHILSDKPFGDEATEQFQANLTRYENLLN